MRTPEATAAAILGQLRREWRARGSQPPDIVEIRELPSIEHGGRALRPLQFDRFRRKSGLIQPDTLGRLIELRFARPAGPAERTFSAKRTRIARLRKRGLAGPV